MKTNNNKIFNKNGFVSEAKLWKKHKEIERKYNDQLQIIQREEPEEDENYYREEQNDDLPDDVKARLEIQADYDYLEVLELIKAENEDLLDKCKLVKQFTDKYIIDGKSTYTKKIHKQNKFVEQDNLNRRAEAKKIAELIKDNKIKTIGVFGEWGTGKSTFLEFIKQELNGFNEDKKTIIVDIKATEYSDRDQIWTYFLSEMEERIKKGFDKEAFQYRRYKALEVLKKMIIPIIYFCISLVAMIILLCVGLSRTAALLMGIKDVTQNNFSTVMNILIIFLFVWKFFIPIINQFTDMYNNGKTSSDISSKDISEKLGFKAGIKKRIQKIVDIWDDYKFVFCVDELDRCNKAAVMSFLESIQLIDEMKNLFIVYAIDEEVVIDAIKDAGFKKPHNYLRKYVDKKEYLESINYKGECIEAIAKEYDFFDEEIEKIKECLLHLQTKISVRDFLHIMDIISEFREKWINDEVKDKIAIKEKTYKSALNWYNFIPILICYLEDSFWIMKIRDDFFYDGKSYPNVSHFINNRGMQDEYGECPSYFKDMILIDILRSVRFIEKSKVSIIQNEYSAS